MPDNDGPASGGPAFPGSPYPDQSWYLSVAVVQNSVTLHPGLYVYNHALSSTEPWAAGIDTVAAAPGEPD